MIVNNEWVENILNDWDIALLGFADLSEIDFKTRMGYDYGISIAIALDPVIVGNIPKGPFIEYYEEYKRVNRTLKKVSFFLTEKIKERGFDAFSLASQKQNEDFRTPFPFKTLATRAGLGWIGRSAAFVTKDYGNAIRLNGVLTSMPFETGTPVNSPLCGDCRECVTHCPANAISGKLWDLHTDRDELLNARKCKNTVIERGKPFNITEGSCGMCLAVCPRTKAYISSTPKS